MKRYTSNPIAALAGLGALMLLAAPAAAHGAGQGGNGPGFGMGPGMMGTAPYGAQQKPGYGPGAGMGTGMMGGPAMMHGMMHGAGGPGYGMGAGFAPCTQNAALTGEDLEVDDVKARMERWLAVQGNDRLKLGAIEAVDDDTITVEIVTVDGSLVQKLAVDRHNGWTRPAK